MKTWMIPKKGKGHEVTARNIAQGDPMEESRPLTTDPWDNALMTEDEETDKCNSGRNGLRCQGKLLQECEPYNTDRGGADTSLARESSSVMTLGLWSPTSQMGGRVFSIEGIAPSIMAGTHGYGFGCILVNE